MTTIRTRSKAPFALVNRHGELIGYAHSRSERVEARARRQRARILPIVNGRVDVPADRP